MFQSVHIQYRRKTEDNVAIFIHNPPVYGQSGGGVHFLQCSFSLHVIALKLQLRVGTLTSVSFHIYQVAVQVILAANL